MQFNYEDTDVLANIDNPFMYQVVRQSVARLGVDAPDTMRDPNSQMGNGNPATKEKMARMAEAILAELIS